LLGILLYPALLRYQASAPQRILAEGVRQESLGRMSAALQEYGVLVRNYPAAEEAPDALYRIARIWHYDLEDLQRALLTYLQLERDYPASSHVQSVRESVAQILKYDLRDDMQAIGYYQRLIEEQAGTSDRYRYEIADSYFRLENYPQARIELENLLAEHPDSALIEEGLHRKATILTMENRAVEAQQDWLRLIEQFPHSSYVSQARFNLARLLEEQGKLEEALEAYQQLEDFPRPRVLEEKIHHLLQRLANRDEASNNG
jgi:TolA-binding protein